MASLVTTEILISVGEISNPSGTQLSFDVATGLSHVSAHKERIKSRTGEDPRDFKVYITIPCETGDHAQKLAELLRKTYEEASQNAESIFGMIYSKIKPDPEEPALASLEFSSYLNNTVIIVTADQHEEQAMAMFGMAAEQAADLLNTSNSLHIEVDTGRSAGEILTPQLAQMLTESALFKIVVTHDPEALIHARQTATNLGAPKQVTRSLAYASLYSGAALKLNFKSGVHLPESIQAILNGLSAMIPPLDQVLPPDVTAFVHGVFEQAGHEVFINVVAGNIAKESHISLKGASQIFQLN